MLTRLLTLFAFSLLAAGIFAAEKPLSVRQEFTSPYDIEIVIFERFGQGHAEHWPAEPGEPAVENAVGDLGSAADTGPDVIILPKENRQLGPVVYTLKRKGALVHAHQLWRQDLKGRKSNAWYLIGDRRLNGLIRISKGRYLHLDTDLLLQVPGDPQPYRIQLHRRMRSGETHYIDHPMAGIVIHTERVEAVAAAEPEATPEPPVPVTPEPQPQEPDSPTPNGLPRAMPDPT